MLVFTLVFAACVSASSAGCSSSLDCSLNGECVSGGCVCDEPWTGDTCGALAYKTTPAVAKSLYNISDPRNTWNGPIVGPVDGKYHIYNCIYKVGSLGGPTSILHGTSSTVEGPWEWSSRPDLPTEGGENAAFVTYRNQSSGATVYSLWIGGTVRVAAHPDGPFTKVERFTYPGGNPAPLYHNNAFFMTNQGTTEIYTATDLAPGAQWTKFADVDHGALPSSSAPPYYHVEDPFMWVDGRGNWHIINHAYKNAEYEHCGSSTVSAHFFSADGKAWHVDREVHRRVHAHVHDAGAAQHGLRRQRRAHAHQPRRRPGGGRRGLREPHQARALRPHAVRQLQVGRSCGDHRDCARQVITSNAQQQQQLHVTIMP